MMSTFASVQPLLNLKRKKITIDNMAFKFHYRGTFLILVIASILVTSRQYIGEHIRCITSGPAVPENVMNTFCFFTSTFTVVKHLNNTALEMKAIPHAGVGPVIREDEIIRHAYYQWVPFVLFLQAILFYLPHIIWRSWEGGKIKALANGLIMVKLSKYLTKGDLEIGDVKIPAKDTLDGRINIIRKHFFLHIDVNKGWGTKMVLCEFLNLVNLFLNIWFTEWFLGYQFLSLGVKVAQETFTQEMDVLDIVFPKMTKCHFYKYGASGTIQQLDALCVMALNIINEKIYIFLWYWYMVLTVISVLALLWRLLTLCLHSRSDRFNRVVFQWACPGRTPLEALPIIKSFHFSNWLFLYYLAVNVEPFIFRDILTRLAADMSPASSETSSDAGEAKKFIDDDDDDEDDIQKVKLYPSAPILDTVDGKPPKKKYTVNNKRKNN